MTIKEGVTSLSAAVRRSFDGALSLDDGTVPAVVQFDNGEVSLFVAGDAVGSWSRREVDFMPSDGGYEMKVEGDSLEFVPDQKSEFTSFLVDAEPSRRSDIPAADPEFAPRSEAEEQGASDSIEGSEEPEGPVLDPSPPPSLELAADRVPEVTVPLDLGQPPDLAQPETDDLQALVAEDRTDEFFAAGFNGPPSQPPPLSPVRTPFGGATPQPGDRSAEEPKKIEGEEAATAVEEPSPASSDRHESTDEIAADEQTSELPPPVDRVGVRSKPTADEKVAPQPPPVEPPAPPDAEYDEDEQPAPEKMSESENLRQWGVVIAGGLVVLAILAVVVWGLLSFMTGEEPADPAPEPPPTAMSLPPPTVASTAPTLPPTTVSAENQAAATTFVASWNAIASEYAYHLAIEAGSLPISTAPASTVHLSYEEDGVLRLSMAPKGTGSDRDILLAMGVAVAWAEPDLSPQARRDVLSAMGVDVENPQVSDMGGELQRNGATYSLTVIDEVLRFEASPAT